jgi:hypothetical protein
MLHRVAIVRTDVSEKRITFIIRVTGIGELGATLSVTSNIFSQPIIVTRIMGGHIPPKRLFLQEPHGVTSQKTTFFIVTTVKTSNLI